MDSALFCYSENQRAKNVTNAIMAQHISLIQSMDVMQLNTQAPHSTHMFNTATYKELLDCNHSKAQNFQKAWERGTMQLGV